MWKFTSGSPKQALNLGVFSSFFANKFPILQPPSWIPPDCLLSTWDWEHSLVFVFTEFANLSLGRKPGNNRLFPSAAIPSWSPEKPWEHCGQDFWWAREKGITVKASKQARLVCQPLAPAHHGWTPCLLSKLNPFPWARIYPVPAILVPCQMLSNDSKMEIPLGYRSQGPGPPSCFLLSLWYHPTFKVRHYRPKAKIHSPQDIGSSVQQQNESQIILLRLHSVGTARPKYFGLIHWQEHQSPKRIESKFFSSLKNKIKQKQK